MCKYLIDVLYYEKQVNLLPVGKYTVTMRCSWWKHFSSSCIFLNFSVLSCKEKFKIKYVPQQVIMTKVKNTEHILATLFNIMKLDVPICSI